MVKKLFLVLILATTAFVSKAQELQCEVTVNSEQIPSTDKQVFTEMQNQVQELLNTRRWTDQAYKLDERIKCRVLINLTEMPQIGVYKANVQIMSARPAYGTGYETILFSFIDKDWTFEFSNAQRLDFADNNYTSNFASMLAFYAYMIIGMDNDSFGKLGGGPAYDKARNVLNVASSQGAYPGWKAFEGNRNRYWLIDNLQDPLFVPYREAIYTMHRQGLDLMAQNPEQGRKAVLTVLQDIQKVSLQKPGAAIIRSFFEAKADELVNIFKNAAPADKQAAFTLLSQLDPTNNTKYEVLLKR